METLLVFFLLLVGVGLLVVCERFMDWIRGRKRSWGEISRHIIADAMERGRLKDEENETPKDQD